MAGKHPNLSLVNGVWHFHLKIGGQRFQGSTRARDLLTAKRILEQKRRELLLDDCGITRKVPYLSELASEWMKVHKRIHGNRHLQSVDQHARIWLLPRLGTTRIDRIRVTDVLALRNAMLEQGKSIATVNNAHKVLKLLVGYAVKVAYHALKDF